MKPIVILGMHRSGTSATTRALGLLGASMGPLEDMGKFWENQPMRRVNEALLEAFGGGWECPPPLPEDWLQSPEARTLLPLARDTLAAEYGDAEVMVWKDPRTCTTLPFWRQVFDEEPVIVFIHRHPVEVAGSLLTRNGLSRGHAFAVWERFNADALSNSVGLQTVTLRYVPLVEDPIGSMNELVASLAAWGVTLPRDPATTDMELTPSRRHHHTDADDAFDDPLATGSQRDLFALLRELPKVSDSFALPRPVPEPDPLSVELLAIAAKARASRRDARAARNDLDHIAGSRKRLLRRLLAASMPGGSGRATSAPPPRAAAANPPPVR
jgi:hypothetical protein